MNNKTRRRWLFIPLLAAMSCSALAVDAEKQSSTREPATAQVEEPSPSTPEKDAAVPENQPPVMTPPGDGAAVEPLKTFKPTDKIQADSAVSFPIDI